MRRFGAMLTALVVVLAVGIAVQPEADLAAQDGTTTADHPLVGAWRADTDADSPDNTPSLFLFHDDGTYLQTDPDGSNGVGAWAATGPTTAELTAIFHGLDETGAYGGGATVRASIEVSDDQFTADYTLEFTGPDGMSTGEMGPGRATGERIQVEAMGTPAAPMQFDAATPTGG